MLLKVLFSVALVIVAIDAALNPIMHDLIVEEEYGAEGSKLIQTFDSSSQELAHVAAQKAVNELLETGETSPVLAQPRQAESQRASDRVKGQVCLTRLAGVGGDQDSCSKLAEDTRLEVMPNRMNSRNMHIICR